MIHLVDKKISLFLQEEFHRTTFVNYYRTVEEFKAPFESSDSPVSMAGLSLVSIETKAVPCPYREKWLQNRGDPAKHARWFMPTTRTWSNATFTSEYKCSPRLLQDLCRCCILETIPTCCSEKVNQLLIPSNLKDYLLYK